MPAGYLGVSVFFTLSGFLITRLLLAEFSRTGRIALGPFAARRLRRLVPASLLCLMAVLVARGAGAYSDVPELGSDVVAAATQTFNWFRLAGSSSYADLFSGVSASTVSPVEHFWSLSIEEQFYLVWPLGLFALLRRFGLKSLKTTARILGVTALAVVAAPLTAVVFGPEATYWATTARLAEILLGASLAALVHSGLRIPARASWLAPISLFVIIVLSMRWPSDGGPAYEGWLPAFAVLSTALIFGLLTPSRFGQLLSWRPLVWIGGISYGLYLFHWPIFTLLRDRGWTLDRVGPFTVAVALTFVAAMLSSRFLELPIRAGRTTPKATATVALGAVLGVIVLALFVPQAPTAFDTDDQLLARAAIRPVDSLADLESIVTSSTSTVPETAPGTDPQTTTAPPDSAVSTAVDVSRPVRILVVGDSTAQAVGEGLANWAVENPETASVSVLTSQGFGFVVDGSITSWDGDPFIERSRTMLADDVPTAITDLQPDVVLLMATVNDVTNRLWPGDDQPKSPTDSGVAELMGTYYGSASEDINAAGDATVIWVIPPVPTTDWEAEEMRDPARYLVQHAVIEGAASDSDLVVVDLNGWMDGEGLLEDAAWRPDGTHLSNDAAADLARRYLGPFLVDAALAARLQ